MRPCKKMEGKRKYSEVLSAGDIKSYNFVRVSEQTPGQFEKNAKSYTFLPAHN